MPSVYEVITQRIIQQLESGTAPWHKPWKARGKRGLPRNLVSGREYRGINVWILLSSGYASPHWLTFRQARELGGHVRQGETGLPVVYWKFGTREVQDGDEIIEKKSVVCRYYTVFNVDQCEGLRVQPAQTVEDPPEAQPIESCEQVGAGWLGKPTIRHGGDLRQLPQDPRLRAHAGEIVLRQRGGILQHPVSRTDAQHRTSDKAEPLLPYGFRAVWRPQLQPRGAGCGAGCRIPCGLLRDRESNYQQQRCLSGKLAGCTEERRSYGSDCSQPSPESSRLDSWCRSQ
jgi:hypothetical protein